MDVVFDVEEASGHGISNSVGLAGYPNIDVVRIPGEGTPLSTAPYVARAIFRYVFPLSKESEAADIGPLGVLKSVPVRRLQFRAGKMSLADFFDVNPVGSDSHLQFMNWTIVNNGAWDYAADTRGYTYAAILEYDDRSWAVRFARSSDAHGGKWHRSGHRSRAGARRKSGAANCIRISARKSRLRFGCFPT